MISRLPKILLVAALIGSLGLHWGLLQSVAWVRMVVLYAQNSTLLKAVSQTLDGEHPCSLCKAIAKGKRSEKKPDTSDSTKKSDFSYAAISFVFQPPELYSEIRLHNEAGAPLNFSPPVPPPRQLAG